MFCPLISRCKAQVAFEHYANICTNISEDAYKRCTYYQQQSQEKKTPSEWASEITGIGLKP